MQLEEAVISKELLNEVLDKKIKDYFIKDNYIVYRLYGNLLDNKPKPIYINIYELMHLMKEWALKQGYLLYSVPTICFIKTLSLEYIKEFSDVSTELDAVFKSTQYIYDKLQEAL